MKNKKSFFNSPFFCSEFQSGSRIVKIVHSGSYLKFFNFMKKNKKFFREIDIPFSNFSAIAASAPVAQFDAPCDAFGRIVTADYTAENEACSSAIRSSWASIDNVTSNRKKMFLS